MAIHIKELKIDTFRGINDLEIKNLGDINIITGDNNTGKTSVLEILKTLSHPCTYKTWLYLGHLTKPIRGSMYDNFNMLFNVNNPNKIVRYSIIDSNNSLYTVEVEAHNEELELSHDEIIEIERIPLINDTSFNEDSDENSEIKFEEVNKFKILFKINNEIKNEEEIYDFQRRIKSSDETILKKSIYVTPSQHLSSDLFFNAILNDPILYEEMLNILKLFDDGIISINSDNKNQKEYTILSKNNKTSVPLSCYGDGIKKAILLLAAVVAAKDGILLLDEFEIAIHTSAMNEVFSWIINTCIKLNVQLFMTSHSEEAIDKVLKCSPELQDKMRLITLYSNEDKIVSRIVDGKKAIKLKDELGVELR